MDQALSQPPHQINDQDASSLGFANRRAHVRVYYPEDCAQMFLPELIVQYRSYQVLDISEGGIRFAVPHANLIHDGPISARLRFPDNTSIEISGVVVRKIRNQIALKLEKGIPYCRIMSEQLRLRNLVNNGLISYE